MGSSKLDDCQHVVLRYELLPIHERTHQEGAGLHYGVCHWVAAVDGCHRGPYQGSGPPLPYASPGKCTYRSTMGFAMSVFNPKDIKAAGRVARFMMELQEKFMNTERGEAFMKCIPFGDMAYGQALADWYKNGCPKQAWFSYAEGQMECPVLLEFRKEISKEFGLPILTREESEIEELKHRRILSTKVFDWGLN